MNKKEARKFWNELFGKYQCPLCGSRNVRKEEGENSVSYECLECGFGESYL